MCYKAVGNYPYALEFFSECYKAQKVCDIAVDTYPSTIKYALDRFKTQEMCNKIVSEDPFKLKYYHDRYITSKVCNKSVMIRYVVFCCDKMSILSVDLNSINLDYTNYDVDDPQIIINIRLLVWYIKFAKRNALKKELNEKLILLA